MTCHRNRKSLVNTHLKYSQRIAESVDALIVCSTTGGKKVDGGATASTADGTQVKGKYFA